MFGLHVLHSKSAVLALVTLFPALVFAQMGGGMGGGMMGGALGSGMMGGALGSGMMGGALGSGMMGNGAGMMEALTLGPDGTPYLLRRSLATTATQGSQPLPLKNELVAIDKASGAIRWKLDITGNHVSEPAVAKDRLFLTVSDSPMFRLLQPAGTPPKARLLVVSTTAAAASVTGTVEIDSDLISAPILAVDEAGNSTVYVIGYETAGLRGADDRDSIPAGDRDLYAFSADGRLKFKTKLSQAGTR